MPEAEFTQNQLYELSVPFPARVIHDNPNGFGSYVAHHLYVQRLLLHLGHYDFTLTEIVRGHVDGIAPNPKGNSAKAKAGSPALSDAVVGAVCRLSVVIDGHLMVIDDVGDCESPHNWPHDGARLKDAMSDALKRCCARIGLGTHLYAKVDQASGKSEFILRDALRKKRDGEGEGDDAPE